MIMKIYSNLFKYDYIKSIFLISNHKTLLDKYFKNPPTHVLLSLPLIFVEIILKFPNIYSLQNNNIYNNKIYIQKNLQLNSNSSYINSSYNSYNIKYFDNNLPVKALLNISKKYNIKIYNNHSVTNYN